MGRWSYSNKTEADSLKKISIVFLKEHGYLSGWCSGTMTWSRNGEKTGSINIQSEISESQQYLRITYTQTDNDTSEKNDFDYKIPLTTTLCHYGGKRYWFICPWYKNGVYCGKRVGVLYKNGDYFACRHCYDLTYESCNASRFSRLFNVGMDVDELDKLGASIKRCSYRGRPTKRYKRYLEQSRRMELAMMAISKVLK